LTRFTIDAQGVSFLLHSDQNATIGRSIVSGTKMRFKDPTNGQASVRSLRDFVNSTEAAVD